MNTIISCIESLRIKLDKYQKDNLKEYPTRTIFIDSFGDLADFQVPLPSLPEQRKIVYVLDSIQEAIRVQDEVIEKAKELKRALMKKLFTEGTRGEELKETEIGSIPESWEVVKFAECLKKSSKKFKIIKLKQKEFQKSGKHPIIDQGTELISGYIDDESKVYNGELPAIIFGDHTRVFKFIDFKFAIGADGTKLIYPKENIDIKYFFYALINTDIESRGYNRHYSILRQKYIPLSPLLPSNAKLLRFFQLLTRKLSLSKRKKHFMKNYLEQCLIN